MLVIEYIIKIKGICDALRSINVIVDEDEMVQVCIGGLVLRTGKVRIVICTQEKLLSFFDLQSMLMVEENHASGSRTTQSDNRMLYMEANQPMGVDDEVGWLAMEDSGKSKTVGTKIVLRAVLNPP